MKTIDVCEEGFRIYVDYSDKRLDKKRLMEVTDQIVKRLFTEIEMEA